VGRDGPIWRDAITAPTPTILAGGIAAMAAAIGLCRFGYTPLLPVMLREGGLDTASAGLLASANFAGYLAGALSASRIARRFGEHRVLAAGLALMVLTMAGMGLSAEPLVWAGLRLVNGLVTGWIFVLASAVVLAFLAERGLERLSGWHFGGVGVGIVLSGLLVPALAPLGGAAGGWLGLAAGCGLLGAVTWHGLTRSTRVAPHAARPAQRPPAGRGRDLLPYLAAAYGFEGAGYVVTGTFLVAALERSGTPAWLGSSAWAVVGLAAMPSSVGWALLAGRIGARKVLVILHLLQAGGIALPVLWPGVLPALAGAVLFGGTFLAIVGLALSFGRTLTPDRPAQTLGMLTVMFGLGQAVSPTLAGLLARHTGSLDAPALAAAAAVLLGGLILLAGPGDGRTGAG
jgi:MFS family permease